MANNAIFDNTVKATNQVKTSFDFVGCDHNLAKLKIAIIGNSIMLHHVKDEIGWHKNCGMAASDLDHDFVHVLLSKLFIKEKMVSMMLKNGSAWEQDFTDDNKLNETMLDIKEYQPDVIIVRIGENFNHQKIINGDSPETAFTKLFEACKLITTKVFATSLFWPYPELDLCISNAAKNCDIPLTILNDLGSDNSNMAIGEYEHRGVALHPNDKGMQIIAERIYKMLEGLKPQVSFGFKQGVATKALQIDGYYVWDGSVIKENGKYWMFSSRWEQKYGFGWNWLFRSVVCLSVSDTPEGPFRFVKEILPPRGREFFDGMNTHNPCIKKYNGKFYLYYFGNTYDCNTPANCNEITEELASDTWKKKRIGLAIADKIDGDYIRRDTPLFEPREYPNWDSTITTNPTVIIKPNGNTWMLYKSSKCLGNICREENILKVGIAFAEKPDGPFKRLSNLPLFEEKNNISVEDPYVWFDESKNRFCVLGKDCVGNVAEMFGNLFYGESDDCVHFEYPKNPTAIRRRVVWKDGHESLQCNLERPCILFNDEGQPEYIYCASGDGDQPYWFKTPTYVLCIKLEKE